MAASLRWLTTDDIDVLVAASALFDDPVRPDLASDFLDQANHHLCLAFVGDQPAGFVSGMEIRHPDKAVEMLLYELGVDDAFRRRGIGRQLVLALLDRAGELGCRGMWVPLDDGDEPALATYRSAGPSTVTPGLIAEWDLTRSEPDR